MGDKCSIFRWALLSVTATLACADIVFPDSEPQQRQLSRGELAQLIDTDLAKRNTELCPEHFCLSDGRTPRMAEDWFTSGCFCDADCARYGDCCRDAVAAGDDADADVTCETLRNYGGVYLVTSCPAHWANDVTRERCERAPELLRGGVDVEDPMAELPVTNRRSRMTYRNIFCAQCHDDAMDVVFWSSRVECPSLKRGNWTEEKNNATSGLRQRDDGRWGVYVSNSIGGEEFHGCSIDPYMPEEAEFFVRRCRDATSTCAADWEGDSNVELLCASYNAYVYDVSERKLTGAYRNPHCAVCNHVQVANLVCTMALAPRFLDGRVSKFNPHAFSILLDVGDRSGSNEVGVVEVCSEGKLWDPFFRKCRKIRCDDGFHLVEDSCEPVTISRKVDPGILFPDDIPGRTAIFFPDPEETPSIKPADDHSAFTTCPKFYLQPDEFSIIDNRTVFVPFYDRKFSTDEFALRDNELVICAVTQDFSKFDEGLVYVSLICLSISIVCLVFHLIVFCLVRELRNLSGWNLAALCVSLLVAYVCFMMAPYQTVGGTGCSSVGVVMYAAFIASFGWMNVMAFDVFTTLRQASVELRVSSGGHLRRFLLYAGYVTLLTVVLASAAAAVDAGQTGSAAYRPGFGTRVCWFSRRKALMVWFAVPLALIMAANVFMFIGSTRIVKKTTDSTASISCGPCKVNLRLYVRLAVICGLSWVVGLVAGWLDFQPLWYAFVVLNTLQGVFIFVSFTMADRVRSKVWSTLPRYYSRRSLRGAASPAGSPASPRSSDAGGEESRHSATPLTRL